MDDKKEVVMRTLKKFLKLFPDEQNYFEGYMSGKLSTIGMTMDDLTENRLASQHHNKQQAG